VFHAVDAAAAERLDTTEVDIAADIGGAQGSLLRCLMQANPKLKGVLSDLPHVVAGARRLAENSALAGRLTIEGGSFLETIPATNLCLMRTILHDWPDDRCISVLQRCRPSANPEARLVVIEIPMEQGPNSEFTAQPDLTMMVSLGGRKRTLNEYAELLSAGGLEMRSVVMLCPPFSLIEAVAV
jgi:hypothetical protein